METEKAIKIMDTSRLTIVRSARNNKVLMVDDYLYHIEDRGQNTFRWVCAKRKAENCRARLITTPVVGDDTRHVVVKVSGSHTHERTTKTEVEPKTKRTSLPEQVERTHITRISPRKIYERQLKTLLSDDNDEDDDDENDIDDYDEEVDYIEEEDEGEEEEEDVIDEPPVVAKKSTYRKKEDKKQDMFKTLSKFQQNKVYMLRTHHNRELVCVNGFLYRLEGKSKTSATFRWECIRSDANCKTRIYTERLDDARHNLKQLAGNQIVHDHDEYTPAKLSKLIEKHNITVVNIDTPKDKRQSYAEMSSSVADPLSSKQKSASKSEASHGNKKIILLPSAGGNKVLCVDKMMYLFDKRSPCERRTYWACYFRHSRRYKCNARIVTQNTGEGLRITKSYGNHNHPDHSVEIKKQINMMSREKKSTKQRVVVARQTEKLPRKRVIVKNFNLSGFDSSTSFESSLSSDEPELPERLEDMCQNYTVKNEKRLKLESPEHFDFVDSQYFEDEHAKTKYSTEVDQLEKSPNSYRKREAKRKSPYDSNCVEYDMDTSVVSELRSAKGGVLLCVDGYIYHMKSEANRRNYWICIKNRDYSIKCKSFVTTNRDSDGIKVIHVTNKHNHPVNENDIKRRLCNELIARGVLPKNTFKAGYFLNRTLEEIQAECAAVLDKTDLKLDVIKREERKMKLYGVSDGPPSLAVRMTFKALNIPFELIPVDYVAAEHMTESYAKMNPQKEIPVLDDDGFYLSESIAIMQYLCEKYAPNSNLYPKDPKARALVNHRLCFNMGFYYASISMHAMAPIFFDYPRDEMTLKKVNNALSVFETYLERSGTKYAAADHVTIADLALVTSTMCLEAIGFDLSPYPLVKTWYETFKQNNPALWEIANSGMQEIAAFEKNPPDLSHMNHPFHPTRKTKA